VPDHVSAGRCSPQVQDAPIGRSLAELLGQSDDDALGASDEAESVDVLILRDLTHELGAVITQTSNGVVNVINREHDASHPERVRWGVFLPDPDRCRRVDGPLWRVAERLCSLGRCGTLASEPDTDVNQVGHPVVTATVTLRRGRTGVRTSVPTPIRKLIDALGVARAVGVDR